MKHKFIILLIVLLLTPLVIAVPQEMYPSNNPLGAFAVYLMNQTSGDMINYNGSRATGDNLVVVNTPVFRVDSPNTTDPNWRGIKFDDASTDYFKNTSYFDFGSTWTIAFWYNNNQSLEQFLIFQGNTTSADADTTWWRISDIGSFSSRVAGTFSGTLDTNADIATNWYLVFVQCGSTTASLYINDNSSAWSWTATNGCSGADKTLHFGFDGRAGGNSHFDGMAGGMWVFNTSLTQSQRTNLYTANWTMQVQDLDFPNITFVASTSSYMGTIVNDTNTSFPYIWANVTAYDSILLSLINITIYNKTNWVNFSSGTTSPKAVNFSLDNLPDGNYSLNATAKDSSNNQNVTETRIIRIDRQAPNLGFASPSPINGTYFSNSIFVNASFNDSTSGMNEINISLYNSSGINWSSVTRNTTTSSFNFTNLMSGTYYFNVTVLDYVGNRNTTVTINLTIDSISPNITFVVPTISNSTNTTLNSIWANITAFDDRVISIINVTIIMNNTVVNSSSSSTSPIFANFTNLIDGNYTLRANVSDGINLNATEPRIIIIDTVPPNASLVQTPNNGSYFGSIFINVTANDTTSGIQEINISIFNITHQIINSSLVKDKKQHFVNFSNLPNGIFYYNVTVLDYAGNRNTSLTFNSTIQATVNYTILLNGISGERKYEYGSNVSINITTNPVGIITCLEVNFRNETCSTSPVMFNYTLHPVIKTTFNNSLKTYNIVIAAGDSKSNNVVFNFSTEVDFLNTTFRINASPTGLRDLTIYIENISQDVILGRINNTQLFVDRFTGIDTNKTLYYSQAGTLTVNVNMSVKDIINGNFSIKALVANPDTLTYQNNFTNSSYINATASNGDYPLWNYENFKVNKSNLWNLVGSVATIDNDARRLKVGEVGCNDVEYGNTKIMNLSRFSSVKFSIGVLNTCDYVGRTGSGSGSTVLSLVSDDDGLIENQLESFGAVSCSAGTTQSNSNGRNVTLVYLGSNSWQYQTDAAAVNNTFFLAGNDINIKLKSTASCGPGNGQVKINSYMYDINVSGVGNNRSTNTTYETSFNYTSGILLNASANIISATVEVQTVDDFAGDVNFQLFLSNNGSNFESSQNNQLHTFLNTGTKLYAQVYANTSNASLAFGITNVKVSVVSVLPSNISIDWAQDGIENAHFNGLINNSNETLQIPLNASFDIIQYLRSGNCTGKTCLVPLSITSATAGTLILFNMSIEQQLNNFSLNKTILERYCTSINCTILINFTSNSSGTLSVSDLEVMYQGDANLSVGIVGQTQNTSILVRYSKFNISSPSPFFAFFPQTNSSKFVQPFGQDNRSNVSIFNFTNLASTDSITIWLALNQSLNSCLTLFASNATNLNPIVQVNTTYQSYVPNISVGANASIYFWLNLTQCNPNTIAIDDPYSRFESACDGCTQVWR